VLVVGGDLNTRTSLETGRREPAGRTAVRVARADIETVQRVLVHILHSQKTKAINKTTRGEEGRDTWGSLL